MPQSHAMQTLLEENNELFIPLNNTNTMGMYYTPERRFKLFDCHARDLFGMPHPHGTRVLPELPTLNELIYYFQA